MLQHSLDTTCALIGQKSTVHFPVKSKKTETFWPALLANGATPDIFPNFNLLKAFGLEETRRTP